MLPREHGAWAILIAPILVGLAAAPAVAPLAVALFCLGALAAFLCRAPLQALVRDRQDPAARTWLIRYAAVAAVTLVPLVVFLGRWKLLYFAAPIGLILVVTLTAGKSSRRLTAFHEAAGVLGLCLGAPAAYYAAYGGMGSKAWSLWLLCSAFFSGPIFHVKMAALQHRVATGGGAGPELKRLRLASAVYHAVALAGVLTASLAGAVPAAVAIPFAAALLKTLQRGFRKPARVDFRSLGYLEVAYSVLFVIVLASLECR